MRLLFLNRSFWPDLEATGQLLTELCDDLSELHDVTVIAGPSYYTEARSRRLFERQLRGRLSVIRTWGTTLPKSSLSGRLVNLATYYLLAAVASLRLGRPDVVVAETDPPLLGLLGALLKLRWGMRFVYYCQDLYPDVASVTGGVSNPLLLWILERANRFAYAEADLLVVLGSDMKQRLLGKGISAEKIAVVPNWTDCDQIRPTGGGALRRSFGDKFVVMYSGNLGLSQQLESVLDAADRLRDDQRILFVLIGEGARRAWLQRRAAELELSNIHFLPYRPKQELADSLSAADLHLVPLMAGAAGCMVPSKLYGILAAGRPFVAMMEEQAEVALIAKKNSVGFVSPPGDAERFAQVVRQAADRPADLKLMGERARRLAERSFDRKIVTSEFAAVLEAIGRPAPENESVGKDHG